MTRIVIDTDLHDFNAETLVRTLRESTFYRKLPDAIEAQIPKPKPEVFEHFVTDVSVDGILSARCGKVWRPSDAVTVAGRCPNCVAVVEDGWQA